MKIFKTIIANLSVLDGLKRGEKKTQDIIDNLFKEYPNGKIEDWKFQHVISKNNNQYFSIAIMFETESKTSEVNPLILNQIVESFKDKLLF